MKIKITAIILILLVIIGVELFLYFTYTKKNNQDNVALVNEKTVNSELENMNTILASYLENCKNTTDIDTSFCDIIKDAVIKKDQTICNTISGDGTSFINECNSLVAAAKNDVSTCETISNEYDRDDCYVMVASINANKDLCEKVNNQSSKQECYSQVAVSKKDISLCNIIQDEQSKDWCLSNVAQALNDPSRCELIKSQSPTDYCYEDIAKDTGDVSLCSKIVDESRQTSCYSSKGEADVCGNLENSNQRDLCYIQVVVEKNPDPSICEKIAGPNAKDACYDSIAKETKDLSYCQKISYQETKDSCLYDIGVDLSKGKADESVCNMIQTAKYRDECKRIHFLLENEITAANCNTLEAEESRDVCFYDLAVKEKDYWICARNVNSEYYRGNCWMSVARITKDPSLCIGAPVGKEDECYQGIAVESKKVFFCFLIKDRNKWPPCFQEVVTYYNEVKICDQITEEGYEENLRQECINSFNKNNQNLGSGI